MTTSKTNNDSVMSTDNDLIPVNGELTPYQYRAIMALIESKTVSKAAQKIGVTPRTVFRWLSDPVFLAEMHHIQSGLLQQGVNRLIGLQDSALGKLEDLMNASTDERVALLSAQAILDYLGKWYEMGQLSNRLLQLEQIAEERLGDEK